MRAEFVTFAASLLINAGVLLTLDHAILYRSSDILRTETQKRLAKQEAESIAFEFVETPPSMVAEPPAEGRKVSDRDSAAQDLIPDKTFAEEAPAIKTQGPSDQLAQSIAKPSLMPAPASPAVSPRPEVEPQKPASEAEQKKPESAGPGIESAIELVRPVPEERQPQQAARGSLPSTPSPQQQGASGQGRIQTQEMSKNRSHGAQIYGVTSFEATGSGMGVYMKNLKERIWLAWFPYLMVHYPKDFKSADATLSITLNAQGDVKIVEVVGSQGSPLFSAFCMEAVQKAGPFGPVPSEILDLMGKDELEIKFAFHYW